MGTRISRESWVRIVGAAALMGVVAQFLLAFFWAGFRDHADRLWQAGLGCAAVAFVCGLAARGRPWTMALIVPSLTYLFLLLS